MNPLVVSRRWLRVLLVVLGVDVALATSKPGGAAFAVSMAGGFAFAGALRFADRQRLAGAALVGATVPFIVGAWIAVVRALVALLVATVAVAALSRVLAVWRDHGGRWGISLKSSPESSVPRTSTPVMRSTTTTSTTSA